MVQLPFSFFHDPSSVCARNRITQMPSGGIYPVQDLPSDAKCATCRGSNPTHYCEEWDHFLHAKCAMNFLSTTEGKILIDLDHSISIQFSLEVSDKELKTILLTLQEKYGEGSWRVDTTLKQMSRARQTNWKEWDEKLCAICQEGSVMSSKCHRGCGSLCTHCYAGKCSKCQLDYCQECMTDHLKDSECLSCDTK